MIEKIDIYFYTGDTYYRDTAATWINVMKSSLNDPMCTSPPLPAPVWGHVDCTCISRIYPSCYLNPDGCFDNSGHSNCNPSDSDHTRDTMQGYLHFYRAGLVDKDTILGLDRTLKVNMWNKETGSNIHFADYIDGTLRDFVGNPYEYSAAVRAGYPGFVAFDPDIERLLYEHLIYGTDTGYGLLPLNTYSALYKGDLIKECQYNIATLAVEICNNNIDDDCDSYKDNEDLGAPCS